MNTPTPEQVKGIYKDTYIFFQRYSNLKTDIEAQMMIQESKELYNKYPFNLCKDILLEVCNIIGEYEKNRRNNE